MYGVLDLSLTLSKELIVRFGLRTKPGGKYLMEMLRGIKQANKKCLYTEARITLANTPDFNALLTGSFFIVLLSSADFFQNLPFDSYD